MSASQNLDPNNSQSWSSSGQVDGSTTPVIQVMGKGIQETAVEPQGRIHEGWAVQPQGFGADYESNSSGDYQFDVPTQDWAARPSASSPYAGQARVYADRPSASARFDGPAAGYAGGGVGGFGQPINPPAQEAGKSDKAGLAALVVGIISILCVTEPVLGIVLGIIAVVLSIGAAKKHSGRNGKAVAGRVCGIISICFSVVMLAMGVVVNSSIVDSVYDFTSDRGSYSSDSFDGPAAGSALDVDEDDAAAERAVREQLDKFAEDDPELTTWLATKVEETFADSGYTLADMGVDAQDVAAWLMDDFTYATDGAYTYSDGTGTVYVEIEARDAFDLMDEHSNATDELIDSGQLDGLSESEGLALLGQAFIEAMDATKDEKIEFYAAFDVVNNNGTWEIDQTSWEEELSYLYGLF